MTLWVGVLISLYGWLFLRRKRRMSGFKKIGAANFRT